MQLSVPSVGQDWINDHPVQERPAAPVKVHVVHRNVWAVQSLRIALREFPDLDVLDELADPSVTPESIAASGVDVLLLEATGDAPALIVGLRSAPTRVRVVVLATDSVDAALFTACVVAGAVGIVSNAYSLPQIAEAIRRVAMGWVVLTPEQLAVALSDRPVSRRDTENARRCATLTSRERRVLEILATGESAIETGRMLDISPSTVQTHLKNIMRKLDAPSKFAAVWRALQAGIIEEPQQTS